MIKNIEELKKALESGKSIDVCNTWVFNYVNNNGYMCCHEGPECCYDSYYSLEETIKHILYFADEDLYYIDIMPF